MKLSVKSDYAARAVLGLARAFSSGGVRRVEELAEEQGLPAGYLVQILLELKAAQLVRSLRGKDGGYVLARPPARISFGDVLRAMHGGIFESPALADPRCPTELRATWARLKAAVEESADAVNFQTLLELGDPGRMYYI